MLPKYLEQICSAYEHFANRRDEVRDVPQLIEATNPLLDVLAAMRAPVMEPPPIQHEDNKPIYPAPSGRPPHILEPFKPMNLNVHRRGGDCGVVAYGTIMQTTYAIARQKCFQHGFSTSKGTPEGMVERMLDKAGWEYEPRPDMAWGRVNRFADSPVPGVYLVYSKSRSTKDRHIMPMVNGVLYNWEHVDGDPIIDVTELRPKPPEQTSPEE